MSVERGPPSDLVEWMWAGFVDGAEWVMLPNVIGMALYADGGRMATKPYASGGAYIDRMSDYCKGCRFDRTKRVGPDACPFTTLYWSFLERGCPLQLVTQRARAPLGVSWIARPYLMVCRVALRRLDRLGEREVTSLRFLLRAYAAWGPGATMTRG